MGLPGMGAPASGSNGANLSRLNSQDPRGWVRGRRGDAEGRGNAGQGLGVPLCPHCKEACLNLPLTTRGI